jgi:catechol-2,3-dioxygenase
MIIDQMIIKEGLKMLGSNVIAVDQAALRLTDVDKGLRFFNDILGFKVNFSLQYDGFRVVMLQLGRIGLEMWESRGKEDE